MTFIKCVFIYLMGVCAGLNIGAALMEVRMTIMHVLAVVIGWDCLKKIAKAMIQIWVEIDDYQKYDPEEDEPDDGDI